MSCTFNDSTMSGVAKGGKFSADLKVADKGGASAVSITVDIPLLLSPFKGQIQSTIEKKLASLLT